MDSYDEQYNDYIEENGLIKENSTTNRVFKKMVENAINLMSQMNKDFQVWDKLYSLAQNSDHQIGFLQFNAWRETMRCAGFDVK